jgi:diguanylate cyclase (GGDEF)-like protein/PAS domain S-box-containing protein
VDVLLVEHNPERARAAEATLTAAGHRVETVASGGEAMARLARPGAPDLILVEERLPDMAAYELLRAASRMAVPSGVVVLGTTPEASRWVEATRMGMLDFVHTDSEGAYLTTLATRLDVARERSSDEDRARRLADALDSTSAAVLICARSGHLEYANAASARLLGRTIADLGRLGFTNLVSLDDQPHLRADLFAAMDVGGEWAGEIEVKRHDDERVPCIVTLSPVRRAGGWIDGLVLTLRDVSDRVAMEDALRAANRRLAEQAARDHLTGLYNRGYFREVLEREVARSLRYGDELAILMVDLDGFKAVNDLRSHEVGDLVLKEVARLLPEALREGDVVCRYGGDEFCMLLPNTDQEAALAVAERLRRRFEAHEFEAGDDIRLTLSGGLATSADCDKDTKEPVNVLLRMPDHALLEAKRQGGNRVLTWRSLPQT